MTVPVVWIVSADPQIRWLIELNLYERGLRVWGAESIAQLLASAPDPRLVILDLDDDHMQWVMAEALRRQPWGHAVPLIVLLNTPPSSRCLASLQLADWLEKPFAMGSLLNLVRNALEMERPADAASPPTSGETRTV
ncbi:MAG: hypothetical protein D6759_05255 [Chloroflexi bacterium]|nr:MAG: hypothetical protein D6759_05255 [Chloroflexota bacterium]